VFSHRYLHATTHAIYLQLFLQSKNDEQCPFVSLLAISTQFLCLIFRRYNAKYN